MVRIFVHSVILLFLAGHALSAVKPDTRANRGIRSYVDSMQIDLLQFARSITRGGDSDYERAERLLDWLSHNFKWLSTDYKQRTVQQIIERQGGNCFELATVYMALVKTLGIRYRQVAEINIQPESERRQRSAEDLVKKRGFSGSVFGAGHNDHRWVEIYDERSGEWIPADPSVGVIGLESWLMSRVWYGPRWAIDTSITNDMIVPFAIFTTDSTRRMIQNRTRHYLVTSFNALYDGRLSSLPSWNDWANELDAIGDLCKGAFEGRVNLHRYRTAIERLASTYAQLRNEYEERYGRR